MEVLREASQAQARFERARRRHVPRSDGGWFGRCDEVVGRMCLRLEPSGDWWPEAEPDDVVAARDELLASLERARRDLPGDGWLLGQEVAYRIEAGQPEVALAQARACGVVDASWCAALEGYVLHAEGRFLEAEGAFRRALATGDPTRTRQWSDPQVLLDGEGRDALDRVPEGTRPILVDRFWEMADPLFLVEGNDRWTEHLARRVLSEIREGAANPYALRWGDDLAETLVRYGWEVGWERVEPRAGEQLVSAHAVGHQHPESRSHVPPGAALLRLGETSVDDWNPGSRLLPRTGYAPAYAPVLIPPEGDVLRVPRGDSLVLVAVLLLPDDTTYHRKHRHPALDVPAPFRGRPAIAGIFAQRSGAVVAASLGPTGEGGRMISVAPGEYLVSAEVWAPDSARAGRLRKGLVWNGVPADIATLSDLLVAEAGTEEPATLEAALPHLRPAAVGRGERIRVAWELHGFGWRPETLRYRFDLVEAPGGFLRRLGRTLGLVAEGRAISLGWEESGPGVPGPFFRSAEVAIPPDLPTGDYLIRLRVESSGREPLVSERTLQIHPASR